MSRQVLGPFRLELINSVACNTLGSILLFQSAMVVHVLHLFILCALGNTMQIWAQSTLGETIEGKAEISKFRDILQAVGILDRLRNNTESQYTILAPHNDAINASVELSRYMVGMEEVPVRWSLHLKHTSYNHIAQGQALKETELFGLPNASLVTLLDVVGLIPSSKIIKTAKVVEADIVASNGVLHVIDRLLDPAFFNSSLADLERQDEFGPDWLNRTSLVDVVDFLAARSNFAVEQESGMTLAGCRIRAFNRMGEDYLNQTINQSPSVKMGELLNESFKEEAIHEFIEYSLLPRNFYMEELPDGFEELVMSSNGCAHIWVTKVNGTLCFNEGCVVYSESTLEARAFLANNGAGYVVDECQLCPGIGMLVEYAAVNTAHAVSFAMHLLNATDWNLRNISLSVGNGGPVTMFAGINSGYPELPNVRLLVREEWRRHLLDYMQCMLIQGNYTDQDLKDLYKRRGVFNLTSLNGESITVDYDGSRDVVLVQGADLILPNIRGVDGHVHFITKPPIPASRRLALYDIAKANPDFSMFVHQVDVVSLDDILRSSAPVTVFIFPNEIFKNLTLQIPQVKSLLQNHIFQDVLWCDSLREKNGTTITSINDQKWRVYTDDQGRPCLEASQALTGLTSCISTCDIRASNGVAHVVDAILRSKASPAPSLAPSGAPFSISSIFRQPSIHPTMNPSDLTSSSVHLTMNPSVSTISPTLVTSSPPSDVPSDFPSITPSVAGIRGISAWVNNTSVTFHNVSVLLSDGDLLLWGNITATWFEDYYNRNSTAQVDDYHLRSNMSTTFDQVSQESVFIPFAINSSLPSDQKGTITLTYNQYLSYQRSLTDNNEWSPQQYAALPFQEEAALHEYLDRLRSQLLPWPDVGWGVPPTLQNSPTPSSIYDDKVSKNLSPEKAPILLIGLAGLLLAMGTVVLLSVHIFRSHGWIPTKATARTSRLSKGSQSSSASKSAYV